MILYDEDEAVGTGPTFPFSRSEFLERSGSYGRERATVYKPCSLAVLTCHIISPDPLVGTAEILVILSLSQPPHTQLVTSATSSTPPPAMHVLPSLLPLALALSLQVSASPVKRWAYSKYFDLQGHRGGRGETDEK